MKPLSQKYVKQITEIAEKCSQLNSDKYNSLVQGVLRLLIIAEIANIDDSAQRSPYSSTITSISSNKLFTPIAQSELIFITKCLLSERPSYQPSKEILTFLLLQIFGQPIDACNQVLEKQKQIALVDFHRNPRTRNIFDSDKRFESILSYLKSDMPKSPQFHLSGSDRAGSETVTENMEAAEDTDSEQIGQSNKFNEIFSNLRVSNESELSEFLGAFAEKIETLKHLDGFSNIFEEFIQFACGNYCK